MNICQLRNERDYTQEELAELAEVDRRHLQDIEHGKVDPGHLVLRDIRKALQVSWSEFMGKDDGQSPGWSRRRRRRTRA